MTPRKSYGEDGDDYDPSEDLARGNDHRRKGGKGHAYRDREDFETYPKSRRKQYPKRDRWQDSRGL